MEDLSFTIFGRMEIIRIIPYPPSFSKIAANTIDPAIGASTWAFGNHMWTENIGSFTRKPPRIIIQHKKFEDNSIGNDKSYGMVISIWLDDL